MFCSNLSRVFTPPNSRPSTKGSMATTRPPRLADGRAEHDRRPTLVAADLHHQRPLGRQLPAAVPEQLGLRLGEPARDPGGRRPRVGERRRPRRRASGCPRVGDRAGDVGQHIDSARDVWTDREAGALSDGAAGSRRPSRPSRHQVVRACRRRRPHGLVLNLAAAAGADHVRHQARPAVRPADFLARSLSAVERRLGRSAGSRTRRPATSSRWVRRSCSATSSTCPMWIWERLWSAAVMLLAYEEPVGWRRAGRASALGAAVVAGLTYMLAPRVLTDRRWPQR